MWEQGSDLPWDQEFLLGYRESVSSPYALSNRICHSVAKKYRAEKQSAFRRTDASPPCYETRANARAAIHSKFTTAQKNHRLYLSLPLPSDPLVLVDVSYNTYRPA